MRPFAVRGARVATLCGVFLVCVTSALVLAGPAAANICTSKSVGEGVQDPPGSGIWYQCVRNARGEMVPSPRPDWPEVPAALVWPASALLAFGVYVAVGRRRRRTPAAAL
jgi:hypothetical protein